MGTFKKCKVVMLPTNEKAPITLGLNNLMVFDNYKNPAIRNRNDDFINHHLYITSDDEIKKGDWCYHTGRKIVLQFLKQSGYFREYDALKKIVATTDSSLKIGICGNCKQGKCYDKYLQCESTLPQPSKAFIEKYVEEYNKDNIITDVLVEYENCYVGAIYDDEGFYDKKYEDILKVNPKDNTITIKKVKDIWSRDEVIELLNRVDSLARFEDYNLVQWIEENL